MSNAGVNDCVIKLANVNGTGSASANGLLMKAIFRMGVPVVGKNVFPSNIQGLPTWYEIRITGAGYGARSAQIDMVVAMNAATYKRDMQSVRPGGIMLYDNTWPRIEQLSRKDITVLGIPLAKMCNAAFSAARSRVLMKNMAYVGAVAALLHIDMDVIRTLITEMFAAKPKLIGLNMQAIDLGYDYASEHFDCDLGFGVEPMDKTVGKIMMDGNTAAGLGCVFAGATVGAWYPITPSTSLMDGFKSWCQEFRVDKETGAHNYCIIQAEDELSAIGMVIGAGWNGARAFTPTSGPGISLMSEFIGFAYYAEIPAVLFDVQRVGPSTGMPTRTQQGDIQLCAYASHGDTRHIMLLPADPGECFSFAVKAFDLAERFQTPVFVLSDIDIGMNDWMIDELQWDEAYRPDRGKVLSAQEIDALEVFHRYTETNGDGIAPRTLPGTHKKGAYFTRGSGHNAQGQYTEQESEYQAVVDRLKRKWENAAAFVPAPVVRPAQRKTKLGIMAYGSSDCAVREACEKLGRTGVHLNYMRICAFPFAAAVEAFIHDHEQVFVVEQNRDAQMCGLLLLETHINRDQIVPLLHYSGEPLTAQFVQDFIEKTLASTEKCA